MNVFPYFIFSKTPFLETSLFTISTSSRCGTGPCTVTSYAVRSCTIICVPKLASVVWTVSTISICTYTIAVNAIIIFVVSSIVWKMTIGSRYFILEDASHCFIIEKLPPNDGRGRKYCWLKLVKVFGFRSFSDTPGKPRRLRIEMSAINTVPTTAQKKIYWKGMNSYVLI